MLAIIGMNEREVLVAGARYVAGRSSVERAHRVFPGDDVGDRIPRPQPDAGRLGRHEQLGLGRAQRFLRGMTRGRVTDDRDHAGDIPVGAAQRLIEPVVHLVHAIAVDVVDALGRDDLAGEHALRGDVEPELAQERKHVERVAADDFGSELAGEPLHRGIPQQVAQLAIEDGETVEAGRHDGRRERAILGCARHVGRSYVSDPDDARVERGFCRPRA
jgi:hypothetical protein